MSNPVRTPNITRARPASAKPHLVKIFSHGPFAWHCAQRGVRGWAYGHTPHEAAFRLHPGAAR